MGDKGGEATTLNNVALIFYQEGEYARTAELLSKVIAIFREVGAAPAESAVLSNLAFVLYNNLDQTAAAIEALEASIAILQQLNLPQDQSGMTLAEKQALLAQWTRP